MIHPPSILIADDYDDNRVLLRLMLEAAGYIVLEARDGRECIETALREVPDVALIDLSMPVVDGWSVLRAIRSDNRTHTLPCVAVTAFAAEQDSQRALAAGFNAYIEKPYRSKDLLDLLTRLLAETDNGK
ncbi:MAG: response regulator [Acidobacteriota bacterium]|nr:response regulator [Acidobacteriota bacterium]